MPAAGRIAGGNGPQTWRERQPVAQMGRELSAREHFCSAAGCQGALHRIGEDVSEQLHIPPQTPWVWQHVRFK